MSWGELHAYSVALDALDRNVGTIRERDDHIKELEAEIKELREQLAELGGKQ